MLRTGAIAGLTATVVLLAAGPAGAAKWTWSKGSKVQSANGISCPTASFCVAPSEDKVVTSKTPAKHGSSWTTQIVDHASNAVGGGVIFDDVACPSVSLCVAVDNEGNAFTSTDPTGGPAAWSMAEIDPGSPAKDNPNADIVGLETISCASVTLCATLTVGGNGLTTTAPAAVPAVWTPAPITSVQNAAAYGLSCAGTRCVAVEADGRVAISTKPGSWSSGKISKDRLVSATCASPSLCLLADGDKRSVLISTHPSTSASAWHAAKLPGRGFGISWVACASASSCFAQAGAQIYVTANPSSAHPRWTLTHTPPSLNTLQPSCPTASLCYMTDVGGDIFVGHKH